MENDTIARGGGEQRDTLPDYYLGMLLVHDEMSEDNCKWLVYDGGSRVRCPTRRDAINYIEQRHRTMSGADVHARLIDARLSLNHAITALDTLAAQLGGLEQLQLERLAVRLKPVLVDIDNIIIK